MGLDRMSYTQRRRFTTRRNRSDRRGAGPTHRLRWGVWPNLVGRRGAAAVAAVLVAVGLGACASAPDLATHETFDHRGKRRLESPMVAVELEDGARATLSSPFIPGITFSGVVSGDEREFSLYITEARLFGNWANGWTEGFYEASGVVAFTGEGAASGISTSPAAGAGDDPSPWAGAAWDDTSPRAGAAWRVRVEDPLELWSIETGSIRYYDSYIIGEEGASKVRVRVDRLEAYAAWFRGSAGESFYGDARREGAYGDGLVPAFESALVVASGAPPLGDTSADGAGGGATLGGGSAPGAGSAPPSGDVLAGGTLPEGLARLLGSDTIGRDLREAPSLFLAIYNLEHFTGSVLDGAVLYNRED